MTLYYDGYAGAIATLDGTTVTVAACSSAYVPSASDVDLDAIAVGEIDTGDAAGYARQTVTVTWDVAARRLTFDDPIEFDLDGASDVQHFVVADASGDLAFVLSYDTPIEGYDGFTLAPPVAASEADTAGIEARLHALEAAPGPASPVPDPTGAPDGQVVKTFGGEYVLADESGGGGSAWVAAEPIMVEGAGSQSADLTGIDPDVGSIWVQCEDTVTEVTLDLPDTTADRQPLVIAVVCPGGDAEVKLGSLTVGNAGSAPVIATVAIIDAGFDRLWLLASQPYAP